RTAPAHRARRPVPAVHPLQLSSVPCGVSKQITCRPETARTVALRKKPGLQCCLAWRAGTDPVDGRTAREQERPERSGGWVRRGRILAFQVRCGAWGGGSARAADPRRVPPARGGAV